ncbi:MAG TPA: TAT-variant-translocated molybdopterin oxidoreductase [Vicinamibacterales bacterium]|nr:TAT-variant-translocated molybdopterin oxidoreductase [Vicinamibacterales bacterium]
MSHPLHGRDGRSHEEGHSEPAAQEHSPAPGGRQYWRTLEELADTPEFRELVHREFPRNASEWLDPVGRRNFLKLMGASLALAGATACTRQPDELLVPYVRTPEEVIPGRPLFFATAMTLEGAAVGLLAESHEGRPTKIEGNPDHPASLGATDVYAQAAVLHLFDPDRSRSIRHLGEIRPWSAFTQEMQRAIRDSLGQGTGIRFLTQPLASPTLLSQMQEVLQALPAARWHQYAPVNHDNERAGAAMAFGRVVDTHYRFDRAKVIVSLDADFLGCGPAQVRYARDFANGRRVRRAKAEMNRLYVAEPAPTTTGAIADHRLPVRASRIEAIARALAAAVRGEAASERLDEQAAAWVAAAAADLRENRGAGVVLAGRAQPPVVHAIAHALNTALGNDGVTVVHTEPFSEHVDSLRSLKELVDAMNAGQVTTLVILGGNPVYDAPADLNFAEALSKVPRRVHLSMYDDETSALCHWHVPELHFLEGWSDARAYDGTACIVQPLIQPLYGGRSAHDVLTVFTARPERTAYDAVREYWQQQPQAAGQDFEAFWRKALHDGVIPGTAAPEVSVSATGEIPPPSGTREDEGLEITFAPDPSVYDGRFANNPWLQELPKPVTRLTWDNAVLIAPSTARRLGLQTQDVVEIVRGERSVRGAVLVQPGHATDAITVHLGYGRTRGGRAADGAGFSAYAVRTSDAPWFASGVELRKTGDTHLLAGVQGHFQMENRALVRPGTLEDYRHDPEFARHLVHEPPRDMSLYPEFKYEGHAWGMVIDQTVCTGCSACVIACVAENNIPVVGKSEVVRGREMHWLRVDHYYEGDPDSPAIYTQPVPCMHCENAPCEVVCPVAATTHSFEGLNEMTYNRCIGTRYCSNNCPYKVRRFNFLLYADYDTPSLKLAKNPNVSIRSRGVMEKCTYCVQRINMARQDAKVAGRKIQDGDIKTACQQACPTDAIVFGDINDPSSRVAQLRAEPANYGLLVDLNTRPRTTYLAAIRNPNPALGPVRMHDDHGETRRPGLPPVPPSTPFERNSMEHP